MFTTTVAVNQMQASERAGTISFIARDIVTMRTYLSLG